MSNDEVKVRPQYALTAARLETLEADVDKATNLGWFTPEFWTMVGGGVTNLVAVGVLFGWISATQAETVSTALAAVIGATQVLVLNSAIIWKYLSERAKLRETAVTAKFTAIEKTMQLEQLRMRA